MFGSVVDNPNQQVKRVCLIDVAGVFVKFFLVLRVRIAGSDKKILFALLNIYN